MHYVEGLMGSSGKQRSTRQARRLLAWNMFWRGELDSTPPRVLEPSAVLISWAMMEMGREPREHTQSRDRTQATSPGKVSLCEWPCCWELRDEKQHQLGERVEGRPVSCVLVWASRQAPTWEGAGLTKEMRVDGPSSPVHQTLEKGLRWDQRRGRDQITGRFAEHGISQLILRTGKSRWEIEIDSTGFLVCLHSPPLWPAPHSVPSNQWELCNYRSHDWTESP